MHLMHIRGLVAGRERGYHFQLAPILRDLPPITHHQAADTPMLTPLNTLLNLPAARAVFLMLGLSVLTACSTPPLPKARIDPQTDALRVDPSLLKAAPAATVHTSSGVAALPVDAPSVEQGNLADLPVATPPAPKEPVAPAAPGKRKGKK